MPKAAAAHTPLFLHTVSSYPKWLAAQDAATKRWLDQTGSKAEAGVYALLPGKDGGVRGVLAIVPDAPGIWAIAGLPEKLPAGAYALETTLPKPILTKLTLGWELARYEFTTYRKSSRTFAELATPRGVDAKAVANLVSAAFLVRDLVNTPTEDMTPKHLAKAAKKVAKEYGAKFSEIVGEELLEKNYPLIHAVGRASDNAPRLIDIRWGTKGPKVTLVGKGVCFDSGGLDLKSAAGMLLMKKDMAGAAHALALGKMIMQANLPVQLRILMPAVENSVSGNAFRPMDIYLSRLGKTVEIGNTDAEGRLILCDALAEADSESPDLLVDMATLTGAARTALGTDIPALFTRHDAVAEGLAKHAAVQDDPLWRLPLWPGYRDMLKSKIADLNNAADSPYAGAITAALYLSEFVREETQWLHLDMMAWNTSARPGRPYGGEAMCLRALFAYIQDRFR